MQLIKTFQCTACNVLTKNNVASEIEKITASITAPTLFSYIWWVLKTASENKIERLYFLARDGFLMYTYAKKMSEGFNLPIECKYLFCSRNSLRIPSYHFIGDEADKMIFSGGYRISASILLHRINATQDEKNQIYNEIGFSQQDEDNIMSKILYNEFIEKVRNSAYFKKLVYEKSIAEYDSTIGYLKQEGLLDGTHIAIVDTGWTGSMQRTLRQIVDHSGINADITGFYFGMYAEPKSKQDGEYLTWYFSKKSNILDIVKFNNNLFECMCIAPHPMTLRYSENNGTFKPHFKQEFNTEVLEKRFQAQFDILNRFADDVIPNINFDDFDEKLLKNQTRKILQRFMYMPTEEQALAYSEHLFCDDVSESYMNSIVQNLKKEDLDKYTFLKRLHNKLLNKDNQEQTELFWPYGSIVASDIKCKKWFRFNILIWDILRYLYIRR